MVKVLIIIFIYILIGNVINVIVSMISAEEQTYESFKRSLEEEVESCRSFLYIIFWPLVAMIMICYLLSFGSKKFGLFIGKKYFKWKYRHDIHYN